MSFGDDDASQQKVARERDRLKLLLDINNAVVSQLALAELLRVISESLRRIVPHELTALALYDPEIGQLRAHVLEYEGDLPFFRMGSPIPLEGNPGSEAFETGRPVFVTISDLDKYDPNYRREVIESGIRSGALFPLIAHERKLGVLGIGAIRDNAFSEDDKELLFQVANQIAIAVENSLNFERALAAEQQMARARERSDLLLEINNKIASSLDLSELFKAISACLRTVLHHDYADLGFYDAETDRMRLYAIDRGDNIQFGIEGVWWPVEGTPGGMAIRTRQTIVRDRHEHGEFDSESMKLAYDAGLRSGCAVPLISRDRVLGVLLVASRKEAAFTVDDGELLTQIGVQVAMALENALAYREIESLKNKLSEEKLYLEEEINTAYDFEQLIGSSPALKRILKQVETVAPTDSTVLIQGETGTGKELIARAIHALSSRRERTLVKLNCAAIPMGLLESELFGHEKGAFTGAIAQRIGRFELANKGTLFLDEVGEIPQELQPKLLRVLQEQEFERLGSTRTISVNVRLIAATNRNLEEMVAERRFRDDLFYRLNVFPITIPPLRERREDIPLLVRFFASKFARRMKKPIETIPAESISALQQYHWPGNIRELENFIERAVILTQGTQLHIPLNEIRPVSKPVMPAAAATIESTVEAASTVAPELGSLEAIEREHIMRVLRETNWVVGGASGAAARLGLKRTTLQARMKKLGIERHRTAP